MSEQKSITEEELNSIKELQTQYAKITADLGQLNINKFILQRDLDELRKKISEQQNLYLEAQDRESKLVQELNDKYGEGSLNIETGVFTPNIA